MFYDNVTVVSPCPVCDGIMLARFDGSRNNMVTSSPSSSLCLLNHPTSTLNCVMVTSWSSPLYRPFSPGALLFGLALQERSTDPISHWRVTKLLLAIQNFDSSNNLLFVESIQICVRLTGQEVVTAVAALDPGRVTDLGHVIVRTDVGLTRTPGGHNQGRESVRIGRGHALAGHTRGQRGQGRDQSQRGLCQFRFYF